MKNFTEFFVCLFCFLQSKRGGGYRKGSSLRILGLAEVVRVPNPRRRSRRAGKIQGRLMRGELRVGCSQPVAGVVEL